MEREERMYNKLVTVFAIALLLALTACGRGVTAQSVECFAPIAKEVLPGSGETITVTMPVEQAEEVIAQLEEVQPEVEVVEENEDVVVVEVAPANPEQQQALDNVLKHCEDGKGKDGAKNKHCK